MTKPKRMIRNAVQCLKCLDIIESKDVNDFVRCSCGAVAVDGGQEYRRRVFKPGARFKELKEYVR